MIETLSITTPPSVEPLALSDALVHCRVDSTDTTASDEISALIVAARSLVETKAKMSLVSRSYAWTFDYFPNRLVVTPTSIVWDNWLNSTLYPYTRTQVLWVPKPPLLSVQSITYLDPTGAQQTLDSSKYHVNLGVPGRIAPLPGSFWPNTQDVLGGVTVNFTAGYSSDASLVPAQAVQAIKLLVGHWYRDREAVSEGSMGSIPMGVDALINSFSYGFYA